jgi:hypothetical protein
VWREGRNHGEPARVEPNQGAYRFVIECEAHLVVDTPITVADVPVTADLLRSAVNAINEVPQPDGATLEGCVKAIIEVLVEHGIEEQQQLLDLGSAICARLMAFAALLNSTPAGPWLAPGGNRAGVSFDGPLLEAMAAAPLHVVRGRYHFETDTFFAIVLERSPVAGCS